MRPVALMQHDRTQRPGVLLDYLNEAGIPSVIFTPEDGDDVPSSARDFSGLVLLGSPHSVNELLPWIDKEHALVRQCHGVRHPSAGALLRWTDDGQGAWREGLPKFMPQHWLEPPAGHITRPTLVCRV